VELGYRPRVVHSPIAAVPLSLAENASMPEPLATALEQAAKTNTPLFVDFFAQWCGACKIMDRTTLKNPSVLKTLEQFHFVKVDADEYPVATQYFKVFAMPTYIVLDSSGNEQYRHIGPIDAADLVESLTPWVTP
jgi:thiol:disulfide interchange protein